MLSVIADTGSFFIVDEYNIILAKGNTLEEALRNAEKRSNRKEEIKEITSKLRTNKICNEIQYYQ